MKNFIQFEPVRTLSAALAFGSALIVGAAYKSHWSGEAVGLIQGGWSAFVAVVATFFTRNQVVPVANLSQTIQDNLHNAIVDLGNATGAPANVQNVVQGVVDKIQQQL